MIIKIRQEKENDHEIVENLIAAAFQGVEFSDKQEHFLVQRLRKSNTFIPELSLVATIEEQIVGHILLTKIVIENETSKFNSLALAPVSVLPEFQGNGVGGKLIYAAHGVAKSFGFQSIILIGHANYYPRFGYQKASRYGIRLPFEVPDENSMAIELVENSLAKVNGTVKYPKAFFE